MGTPKMPFFKWEKSIQILFDVNISMCSVGLSGKEVKPPKEMSRRGGLYTILTKGKKTGKMMKQKRKGGIGILGAVDYGEMTRNIRGRMEDQDYLSEVCCADSSWQK